MGKGPEDLDNNLPIRECEEHALIPDERVDTSERDD